MATRPSAVSRTTGEVGSYCASRGAGVSITATRCFTALCTFSKAHTLIWRTRSRETPNSSASSLSVIGSSASRRERLAAVLELLARGECRLLVGMLVDQPVLPFAGITILADRGVERGVAAAEPAVHVDHVRLGDAELPGDDLHLVRSHVALVEHSNLVLGLAQVEEQLLLVHGGAHLHQRPRAQDVFLDRRLDPPCGIGGEPEALVRLEAFDRLHQTDVAL